MSNNVSSAVIFGCSGTVLTDAEKEFFARVRPLGFILFARNIDTPEQTASLVRSLRECIEQPEAPVLIDQEGGRVQRLKPPHWESRPAGKVFGDLYEKDPEKALDAAHVNARFIGKELKELGIDVDCLPLLDVPVDGAHDVIGDRAFSKDPRAVADLGIAVCEGLLAEGVMPVVKHLPGHGRAFADSHLSLPMVSTALVDLERRDFEPFRQLASAPWGMTAHLLYTAVDAEKPASLSKKVISDIIRGYIGFRGFLLCDDLSMKALKGSFEERTVQALDAGCDAVLHCNGDRAEMEAVAAGIRPLSDKALERLARAENMRSKAVRNAPEMDYVRARKDLDGLLAGV